MQSVVDVGSDQTATAVVSTSNLSVTAVTAAAKEIQHSVF